MVNWFNLGSERGGQYKQIADSYYGLVIENFECEQSIYTAVEVGMILALGNFLQGFSSITIPFRFILKVGYSTFDFVSFVCL